MIPVNTVRIVSIAMRLISVTAFAENVYSYKRRRVQQPVTARRRSWFAPSDEATYLYYVLRTMSSYGSDAVRRVSWER
jgi:hypothetical protein